MTPDQDKDSPGVVPGATTTVDTPNFSLDLLMDVELEASIRFGNRQLLLREILAMTPGAVIELDRRVQEPADLLVAGRLVARGEVVVVDGFVGLRITELASANERAKLFTKLG